MKYYLILLLLFCFICCKKKSDDPIPVIAEPTKVYFNSVTSTPTNSESIILKNNSGATADISGWTLGDLNDPTAYNIPSNTILLQGGTIAFSHTTLGFQINDSGEVLYLKNSGTNIDTWTN